MTRDDESAAIALRSVRPDDRAFLLSVYASTREPELATVVDWDAAQKAAFVQMQFDAQHAYYQEHYEGAAFDVILVGGQPAGRLYLHRRDDEIRIMDIALLPEAEDPVAPDSTKLKNGPYAARAEANRAPDVFCRGRAAAASVALLAVAASLRARRGCRIPAEAVRWSWRPTSTSSSRP